MEKTNTTAQSTSDLSQKHHTSEISQKTSEVATVTAICLCVAVTLRVAY